MAGEYDDIVNEISHFDREFTPQSGRRQGIDSLANGDYDLEIAEAELTRTEKTREPLLRLLLRVLPEGGVYEHVYFFRTQDAVNRLGADLVTLGCPLEEKRPFSQQLPRAVAHLSGIRFRAKKAENKSADGGKTYHNLHINARLTARSPMPSRAAGTSEEIPF
jgi:hypothetical protein